MSKSARVHIFTAYLEYLLGEGIRTENAYLGDASRFLRFLLARATEADVNIFVAGRTTSDLYGRRLKSRLRRFFQFAHSKLGIALPPGLPPAGGSGGSGTAERSSSHASQSPGQLDTASGGPYNGSVP